MTTISPSRRRGRRFGSPRVVAFFVLCAALFSIAALWREQLSSVLWSVATPVLNTRALPAVVFSSITAQFASKNALVAESNALRAALASSSILLLDRNLLYFENRDLKLRLGREANSPSILAAVLLAPPGVPYDTLFIDAGSSEGVVAGAPVFAGGSVIVGKVSHVYPHAARVVLLSAPGESYDALLKTQDGTVPLTVAGMGGGSLSGDVPSGTVVRVGDTVLFPGIEPSFAATVVSVTPTKSGSFLTLSMSLPVNLFGLQYVEVRQQTSL